MRFWIGAVVLVLLLALGVGFTVGVAKQQEMLAKTVEKAQKAALSRDWEKAIPYAREARELWEKTRHFAASFADHAPLEQMDTLFSELEIYGKEVLAVEFASVCSYISNLAKAIGESQSVFWWNLL
jgi:hypothetical protein